MYEVDDTELDALTKSVDELTEELEAIVGDDALKAQQPRRHVLTADGTLDDQQEEDEEDAKDAKKSLAAEIDGLANDLAGALNKRAETDWNERVAKVAAEQDVPMTVAMQKARQMFPDEYANYQAAGIDIAKSSKVAPAPRASLANTEFGQLVRGLMNKGMDGHKAMQEIRKSHPDAFESFRNA
jgi:hypothetical protein